MYCKPRSICGMSSRDLGSRTMAPISCSPSCNCGLMTWRMGVSNDEDNETLFDPAVLEAAVIRRQRNRPY